MAKGLFSSSILCPFALTGGMCNFYVLSTCPVDLLLALLALYSLLLRLPYMRA
jgi:hypothetical protein